MKSDQLVKVAGAAAVGLGLLIGVVAVLDVEELASPVTSWTAFGAIATVATAVVAIWTLLALRQDSADRTRPVMVAELRHAVLTANSELRVSNVGQSVARNVTVEFDPPLPVLPEEEQAGILEPFLQRRYSRVIPTFPPGFVMDNYYQDQTEDSEPVPGEFTVRIAYFDVSGRRYIDEYVLSMESVRDQSGAYPGSRGDTALQLRLAKAVEAIARGVGRH